MQPPILLYTAVALILGVTFHEFSHAFVALKLGDYTAKALGRVTLNPLAHVDPIGAILFVGVLFGIAPFAFGKPVPVNPNHLAGGKRGYALVSFAGPASNLLLALLATGLLFLFYNPHSFLANFFVHNIQLNALLQIILMINVSLALFNLLPIYPLDGFNIATGVLPYRISQFFLELQQYGFMLLFVVIMLGSEIISPIAHFITSVLLSIAGL